MALFVVEGQTAPVDYQLFADGAAYNLTGCTVSLVAYKIGGTTKTFVGTAAVLSAAQGTVRFSPDVADLLAIDQGYYVRFRVVRADGKVEFFPTGVPESWVVQK